MPRVATLLLLLLLFPGCGRGADGSFTQESAQRALVEMLRNHHPDDEFLPDPAEGWLADLQRNGTQLDKLPGDGSYDPSKRGWTIDLAAKRFQCNGGLTGFIGEFMFQKGKWSAKATGRVIRCI